MPNRWAEVLASYGEAMLAAQELEEQMIGLVGVRRELALRADEQSTGGTGDCIEDVWEDLFTWRAGRLRDELGVSEEVAREAKQAVDARNLLAHHYLRERASRLARGSSSADMIAILAAATERFKALANRIEVERLAVMHNAGVTDDHVTIPSEARRMRYYDPRVDEDVPPEPFESAIPPVD